MHFPFLLSTAFSCYKSNSILRRLFFFRFSGPFVYIWGIMSMAGGFGQCPPEISARATAWLCEGAGGCLGPCLQDLSLGRCLQPCQGWKTAVTGMSKNLCKTQAAKGLGATSTALQQFDSDPSLRLDPILDGKKPETGSGKRSQNQYCHSPGHVICHLGHNGWHRTAA